MAENNVDVRTSERRGVQRRTVVKGAAWSVPAIVIASQAPAMASSRPPIDIDFANSSLCKLPGSSTTNYCYDKGYVAWLKFENNTGNPASIDITGLSVAGVGALTVVGTTNPLLACPSGPVETTCISIPASPATYVGVFANSSTNSSSTDVTVTFIQHLGSSSCGGASTTPSLTGHLNGGSWTTDAGGGSCKFPPGTQCLIPLDNC